MILWELARATGLTAVVVYTLTAAWGIVLAGRAVQHPKRTLELHRALQSLGLIAIVTHVLALLLNAHAHVTVDSLLGADHRVGILLGTVALWLSIALPLSFALRTRRVIPFRAWRGLHYLGYAFWVVAIAHGLIVGSDTGNVLVLAGYGLAVALVAGATTWRALDAGTRDDAPAGTGRHRGKPRPGSPTLPVA